MNLTVRIIPDWSPFSCAACLGQLLPSHLDNCQSNPPESYFPNPYGLLVGQCSQEGRIVNKREKKKGKKVRGRQGNLGSCCHGVFDPFTR